MNHKEQRIAAFDFDGTLYDGDSFLTFTLHSLPLWRILLGIAKASYSLAKWKIKLIDDSEAKQRLFFALYKGVEKTYLDEKAKTFADVADRNLNHSIMKEFERCKSNGFETALISASLGFWLRPWASRHGFSEVIATEAEVDERGRLTGSFSTPNCKGEEKVKRLLEIYPNRNEYTLNAWGDSDDDVPLLNFADHSTKIKKP